MNIYCDYGNGRGSEGHYYGKDEGLDDMMKPFTNCRRFERRHDFSTFNMSDYMSCENCRHFSAENRCIAVPYNRLV